MKIAVIGSYGAGLTMRVPRAPEAGETLTGDAFESGPGGKGSNQAIGAARLGADVSLLTAIGDDDFGRSALALWRDEGVDASSILISDAAPTMAGFIMVEPSGENRIAIAPGALDFLSESHVEAFRSEIAAADIVLVSMEIPISAVAAALRIGREEGVRTVLNPAPARPLSAEVLSNVDIITPNQTEARIILDLDDAPSGDEALARLIAERIDGAVVLTRGSDGAIVVENGEALHIAPIRAAQVVDTTGAGDSFNAALAVSLAGGSSLRDAAAYGAQGGAHTVATNGVVPALPTHHDLSSTIGESQ
ncbi:ribokinase [Paramicrobacterium chengjingii]|uniref:Ribokinase n=1 Tax=Paramicrobacterium chengjingii TaxID=2769067 RepID=A0ABX6YIL4_9MICO|nr:ribokinase [Microbacterium chengjingii]QPZ38190.1 ribokinase [Microbacterium chengjingii]